MLTLLMFCNFDFFVLPFVFAIWIHLGRNSLYYICTAFHLISLTLKWLLLNSLKVAGKFEFTFELCQGHVKNT